MSLDVYLDTIHVGRLDRDADGGLAFVYDDAAAGAPVLSIRLPRRAEPYGDAECRPFFENLLPEGRPLAAAAKARRLGTHQLYELLREYGRDCPGAVSLLPSGGEPFDGGGYEPMDEVAMADAIRHLAQDPNFSSDRRVRLSLAGAQSKTAVALIDGRLCKPLGGAASTHIVKAAASTDYPDIVENEAFCLALAGRVGLRAPKVEIRRFEDQRCLLIERYDRRIGDGRVRRLHQEDFCQALGYLPEAKYEFADDGTRIGPGLPDCLGALGRTRVPIVENAEFLRRVIFNYLVGNADAHAKNFSLLYAEGASPVLAPAYDVTSTRIYPRLTVEFAMAIGTARDPDALDADAWKGMFGRHVPPRQVERAALDLIDRVLDEARRLMDEEPFGHGPPYSRILSCIGDRCIDLGRCFGREIDPGTPPFILRGGGWAMPS